MRATHREETVAIAPSAKITFERHWYASRVNSPPATSGIRFSRAGRFNKSLEMPPSICDRKGSTLPDQ